MFTVMLVDVSPSQFEKLIKEGYRIDDASYDSDGDGDVVTPPKKANGKARAKKLPHNAKLRVTGGGRIEETRVRTKIRRAALFLAGSHEGKVYTTDVLKDMMVRGKFAPNHSGAAPMLTKLRRIGVLEHLVA